MSSIQSSYSIFTTAPNLASLGDSPNSIDNDPAFHQYANADWEAIKAYQENPSDANVQAAMQATNTLMSYFSKNIPTQANNPKAYAIYMALTSSAPHGSSLAGYCQDYGTNNCQATVHWFQQQKASGQDQFAALYDGVDNVSSVRSDAGKTDIQTDVQNLQSALEMYNWYMNQKNPYPGELPGLLGSIAQCITQLNADAAKDHLSDGYLTSLLTLTNTPVTTTASGAPVALTLEQLSTAALSGKPADLTALQNALNAMGENQGNDGGGLQAVLKITLGEEY
ncbi:MAG: hypothetical protein V4487_00405 [Chlamydiota bacterium]